MEGYLLMSSKERERLKVLACVKRGELKLKEVGEFLAGVSAVSALPACKVIGNAELLAFVNASEALNRRQAYWKKRRTKSD